MSWFKFRAGPRTLALAIILFFILDRAMSLGFLQPDFCVEDERWIREAAIKMAREATLNPGTHKYPELSLALTAGVYGASYLAANLKALPHFTSWSSFSWHRSHYPFAFDATILLGRLLTVALGALALWLFYLLARKVFDEFVSLTAMLFLATAPAFLFSTQLMKNDVLVVIGVVLALLAALKILERGSVADYLLAGLAVGLGLAAKYHAVSVIPLLFAHRLRHADQNLWPAFKQWRWLLIAPAALLAFFLLSPWTFLDLPGAIKSAGLEWAIQNKWDPLLRRSPARWWQWPILFQFSSVLPLALGIPLYLVSLVGLFKKTDLRDRRRLVLWSYPAGFLAFMIAFSELGVPHLYAPAVPFFALLAALVIAPGLSTAVKWKRLLAVAALGAVAGYNLLLFHSFSGLEDGVLRESVAALEKSRRPGERDLALVPYFASPDKSWTMTFAPQFLLSPTLLENARPDRILIHHAFYHAYLDNRELTNDQATGTMVLTFLSLRAGTDGYKETQCWTGDLFTASLYQALWPDLKGIKACIYEKKGAEEK